MKLEVVGGQKGSCHSPSVVLEALKRATRSCIGLYPIPAAPASGVSDLAEQRKKGNREPEADFVGTYIGSHGTLHATISAHGRVL